MMRNRTINEAMWDALHILGAVHTCNRDERMWLQHYADAAERLAQALVDRRKHPLNPAEVRACERIATAALLSAGHDGSTQPPPADTPPGGVRRM